MSRTQDPLPVTVRLAALFLLLYGASVLVNAAVVNHASGWQHAGEFPRAVLRFSGMGIIAWGLWKRARWAWWAGILLPSLFCLGGLVAIGFVLASESGIGRGQVLLTVVTVMPFLVSAIVLLLLPGSRSAFRKAA